MPRPCSLVIYWYSPSSQNTQMIFVFNLSNTLSMAILFPGYYDYHKNSQWANWVVPGVPGEPSRPGLPGDPSVPGYPGRPFAPFRARMCSAGSPGGPRLPFRPSRPPGPAHQRVRVIYIVFTPVKMKIWKMAQKLNCFSYTVSSEYWTVQILGTSHKISTLNK